MFQEAKRARRIRDRDRMRARYARKLKNSSWSGRPDPNAGFKDAKGRKRSFDSWADVFEHRALAAAALGEHAAACSCAMCGNPRRWFKAATLQEAKADAAAAAQFDEADLPPFRGRFRPEW